MGDPGCLVLGAHDQVEDDLCAKVGGSADGFLLMGTGQTVPSAPGSRRTAPGCVVFYVSRWESVLCNLD